jgi:hypothetical protein
MVTEQSVGANNPSRSLASSPRVTSGPERKLEAKGLNARVQIGRGVPVTTVAAQLGHSKNLLTLDTCPDVLTAD